jgi:hypothetical protein
VKLNNAPVDEIEHSALNKREIIFLPETDPSIDD